MADNDDTTTESDGTQEGAEGTGSASGEDDGDVSTLRSRYRGQTAKVNTLTGENKTLKQQLADLQKQLDAAREGTTSADEAAKALVADKENVIKQLQREKALAVIEAKYPETFRELGEDAASLTPEKLASMEARLKGSNDESDDLPTPRGNNAQRNGSTKKSDAEKTSADILADIAAMGTPEWWPSQGE